MVVGATPFINNLPVPAPRHLTLERQLNKSILISWSPPEAYHNQIEMYHVYVDGFLRTTVKASDKTKALVEGVDSHRVTYIVSVKRYALPFILVLKTTHSLNFNI